MPVSEQSFDDRSGERAERCQPWFDEKIVRDPADAVVEGAQHPFVPPPPLKPRTRFLDEADADIDPLQGQCVAVEGQQSEQQQPTPEDHPIGGRLGW